MKKTMSLRELRPGQRAVVRTLRVGGNIRRRLRDLGLINGTEITCLGISPLGDPAAYRVRGAVLALRNEDSAAIEVEPLADGGFQGGERVWV